MGRREGLRYLPPAVAVFSSAAFAGFGGRGLFIDSVRKVSREYPEIPYDEKIVDAACMHLVMRPEQFDVLVMPTVPVVAPKIADVVTHEAFIAVNQRVLRNTSIVNFFNLCAISLPILRDQAVFVGYELITTGQSSLVSIGTWRHLAARS